MKIDIQEMALPVVEVGDIKEETESTVVAAQNQALSENYFKKKFWKRN
jgi:hypothetical protein